MCDIKIEYMVEIVNGCLGLRTAKRVKVARTVDLIRRNWFHGNWSHGKRFCMIHLMRIDFIEVDFMRNDFVEVDLMRIDFVEVDLMRIDFVEVCLMRIDSVKVDFMGINLHL